MSDSQDIPTFYYLLIALKFPKEAYFTKVPGKRA